MKSLLEKLAGFTLQTLSLIKRAAVKISTQLLKVLASFRIQLFNSQPLWQPWTLSSDTSNSKIAAFCLADWGEPSAENCLNIDLMQCGSFFQRSKSPACFCLLSNASKSLVSNILFGVYTCYLQGNWPGRSYYTIIRTRTSSIPILRVLKYIAKLASTNMVPSYILTGGGWESLISCPLGSQNFWG